MIRIHASLQKHWDWRAAGNFMLGGAGAGLLVWSALALASDGIAHSTPASMTALLIGLALIGAGLGCVWLEIGRPWRALNVFRHARTSWMTREGMVATVVLPLGLAAAWFGSTPLALLTGLGAIAFLYCQARILRASKGVPAWRAPAVVSLIVATGLTEGAGLLAIIAVVAGVPGRWLAWPLLAFALARALSWLGYRSALRAMPAPEATLDLLARIGGVVTRWGGLVVALLALPAALGDAAWTRAVLVLGALIAIGVGAWLKFQLVTRAANLQGYGFGKLRRGHPLAGRRAT